MPPTGIEIFFQQWINGLTNGLIIALVALGYTMVYGIVELINFAHGDLVMLGTFLALTIIGALGIDPLTSGGLAMMLTLIVILVVVPVFTASLNWSVDWFAYRPLRKAPRLAPLVSAIGISFIFQNLGLFWGGLPMQVFGGGAAAASPKDVPALISNVNLLATLGLQTHVSITPKHLIAFVVTVPLLIALTCFVKYSRMGKAMRATAQNPMAAELMGIDINRVIGITFLLGGALGGFASVIHILSYNSVHFQLGFRLGMDAFTAAVLGGIGNLPGAMLGGVLIGLVRAMSDGYLSAQWTNTVVFVILILILVFRPTGLLGARVKEKV